MKEDKKKKKKILVVDDEEDLCEILRFNLENEGYGVNTALSAEEALRLDISQYDLLLLDVMMGKISGFQMAKIIKSRSLTKDIPIIFLTAKNTENDTVTGLTLGADDYITKPFSLREVVLRVNAVIRRTIAETKKTASKDKEISFDNLVIDTDSKTVTIDGNAVIFTKTEFELLLLFITHRNKVFSRQELIDYVWPKDVMVLDRTVDVNITRLRKKIGKYSTNLVTRSGFGYAFND